VVDGRFYPAEIALPIPDADEEADVNRASPEGNDTGTAGNESAETNAAAGSSAGSLGGTAVATGAGFASLALVGMAASRWHG
jgi:hypothetical protein